MNGIERIKRRISEDAQKDGLEILSAAQTEAREIEMNYERQAEELAFGLSEKAKKDAFDLKERMAGVAGLEARKLRLAAKQEMITKAFDEALSELISMPDDKKAKLLAKLAAKASQTGSESIVLSRKAHTKIGKTVVDSANTLLKKAKKTANLTLSDSPRDVEGLILSDGEVEINGSFSALIDALRSEMAGEVAKRLFGK